MRTAARVIGCAIVAAVVWYALASVAFAVAGGSFLENALRAGLQPLNATRLVAMNLGPAVWAMLLYWGLEDYYGSTPLNILKAGGGWWLINTLVHGKWFGFGIIRLPEDYGIVTLVITLVVAMIAMYVGAKLFDAIGDEKRGT